MTLHYLLDKLSMSPLGGWSLTHLILFFVIVFASCFMFALREKEIFQNEHHQKSPWERPADAVRPHSLLEGASSPERPQTGEDSRSQLENSSALVPKKKKICSTMFCFTISSSEDHGTLLQRHDGRL